MIYSKAAKRDEKKRGSKESAGYRTERILSYVKALLATKLQ